MSFLTDDQFGQFGQFGQSGNAKMKPFPIEAEEFTPLNWKSGDALYPGERGGFNREDRTLWRKDRYNAVYGRFRDKNGEYRDKSGRFIGENNMPLLEFRETKAFPGWANDPGSQFHPNDHPQVDEGFYRNPENQPGRGLENIGLRVWEDNWNEKGFPIKSEFHDFTTQPGIKEGVNAALRMVDAGQLQDKFPLAAAQALQKVHNSLNAAARQPQVENNTLYQIGELIKSAAPLIGQALSAVMGGTGAEGQAGGAASEVAGTAASAAAMPATPSGPELRTLEHRIGDGSGVLVTMEKRYTDEPPQLTPLSASGPATGFSGGAGGNVGGSFGGSAGESAGSGAGLSAGGTAGPVAGPGYGPVTGTGYGTASAPGEGGYFGGETPSGGAGFGNESLPSGGGYSGGDFPYSPPAGFSGPGYGTWQESAPATPSPEGTTPPSVHGGMTQGELEAYGEYIQGRNVPGASGEGLPGDAKLTFYFDRQQGNLSLIDGTGKIIGEWPAQSGPWGKGSLPNGNYTLEGKAVPVWDKHAKLESCQDAEGNAWWQRLKSAFPTNRTGLGIHPDGGVKGTAGCIGVQPNDTSSIFNLLRQIGSGGDVIVK